MESWLLLIVYAIMLLKVRVPENVQGMKRPVLCCSAQRPSSVVLFDRNLFFRKCKQGSLPPNTRLLIYITAKSTNLYLIASNRRHITKPTSGYKSLFSSNNQLSPFRPELSAASS
ncbi:hypothetical protein DFH11DRAFT_363639 [Phellopilus nigrolimitatus]|nr:hypothetical protein DFH11DRAFT_363639 [Phellopilus nigrolimitatus]